MSDEPDNMILLSHELLCQLPEYRGNLKRYMTSPENAKILELHSSQILKLGVKLPETQRFKELLKIQNDLDNRVSNWDM